MKFKWERDNVLQNQIIEINSVSVFSISNYLTKILLSSSILIKLGIKGCCHNQLKHKLVTSIATSIFKTKCDGFLDNHNLSKNFV